MMRVTIPALSFPAIGAEACFCKRGTGAVRADWGWQR